MSTHASFEVWTEHHSKYSACTCVMTVYIILSHYRCFSMMSPSHALLHSLVSNSLAWSLWYTVQWFPYLGSCCLSVQGGHHYNRSYIVCMHIAAISGISFVHFSLLSPFPIYCSHPPPFPLLSLAISHLSSLPISLTSASLSLSLIFLPLFHTLRLNTAIQALFMQMCYWCQGRAEHSCFEGWDIARRLPFVLIPFFVVLG